MDTSQAEALFDKIYIQAWLSPDQPGRIGETVIQLVEDQARNGLEAPTFWIAG